MAPLKMEEQMKRKLETRTINPSPGAWSKLEEQLDNKKPSSNRRPFWWLSLAAAAVTVIFLMINRGQNNEVPTDIVPVVEAESDSEIKLSTDPVEDAILSQEEMLSESDSRNMEVVVNHKTPVNQNDDETSSENTKKIPQTDKVVLKKKVNIPKEIISSPLDENIETQESLAITEAHKKNLDSSSEVVAARDALDSEVDKLLNRAILKVQKTDGFEPTKESIKAQALLQDVEDDLDKSFRERVFKALVSGYESVKTAVAERNN